MAEHHNRTMAGDYFNRAMAGDYFNRVMAGDQSQMIAGDQCQMMAGDHNRTTNAVSRSVVGYVQIAKKRRNSKSDHPAEEEENKERAALGLETVLEDTRGTEKEMKQEDKEEEKEEEKGEENEEVVWLRCGRAVTFGRHYMSTVRLRDVYASRHHAAIIVTPEGVVWLCDTSANGVYASQIRRRRTGDANLRGDGRRDPYELDGRDRRRRDGSKAEVQLDNRGRLEGTSSFRKDSDSLLTVSWLGGGGNSIVLPPSTSLLVFMGCNLDREAMEHRRDRLCKDVRVDVHRAAAEQREAMAALLSQRPAPTDCSCFDIVVFSGKKSWKEAAAELAMRRGGNSHNPSITMMCKKSPWSSPRCHGGAKEEPIVKRRRCVDDHSAAAAAAAADVANIPASRRTPAAAADKKSKHDEERKRRASCARNSSPTDSADPLDRRGGKHDVSCRCIGQSCRLQDLSGNCRDRIISPTENDCCCGDNTRGGDDAHHDDAQHTDCTMAPPSPMLVTSDRISTRWEDGIRRQEMGQRRRDHAGSQVGSQTRAGGNMESTSCCANVSAHGRHGAGHGERADDAGGGGGDADEADIGDGFQVGDEEDDGSQVSRGLRSRSPSAALVVMEFNRLPPYVRRQLQNLPSGNDASSSPSNGIFLSRAASGIYKIYRIGKEEGDGKSARLPDNDKVPSGAIGTEAARDPGRDPRHVQNMKNDDDNKGEERDRDEEAANVSARDGGLPSCGCTVGERCGAPGSACRACGFRTEEDVHHGDDRLPALQRREKRGADLNLSRPSRRPIQAFSLFHLYAPKGHLVHRQRKPSGREKVRGKVSKIIIVKRRDKIYEKKRASSQNSAATDKKKKKSLDIDDKRTTNSPPWPSKPADLLPSRLVKGRPAC
ncbi:hypothetical protein CBR_g31760 [Chara braunii]|uniref:FHA domain-containing protein n=1 Tax=Chara braunii TaxID=69332 RepID=A0A388JYG4_CHABU|nr:hypothetical protein CBR_g31760 [Chara braunii]|eukprot:GBG62743.1 hypothetical protein CBR_g31760 [Chara braunii]